MLVDQHGREGARQRAESGAVDGQRNFADDDHVADGQ